MGTSSARQAPVGKFWRIAKTSASRFASGKGASPPQVQEVVARYLTALQSHVPEGSGKPKNFLPDAVRTAASLGNFYRDWEHYGLEAALDRLELKRASSQALEEIIPVLLDKLAGPGSRLDEAVVRAALIDHLGTGFLGLENYAQRDVRLGPDCPASLAGVSNFLGLVLFRKLLSDLGEPLEFHATTINLGAAQQEAIKLYIMKQVKALAAAASPEDGFSCDQIAALQERLITYLGGSHDR